MTSEDQFDDVEEFEDEFEQDQPKRKSPIFNIIMYGLLIGGVAYGYVEFNNIMARFMPSKASTEQVSEVKGDNTNTPQPGKLVDLDMPPMPTLDEAVTPMIDQGNMIPNMGEPGDDFMLDDADMAGDITEEADEADFALAPATQDDDAVDSVSLDGALPKVDVMADFALDVATPTIDLTPEIVDKPVSVAINDDVSADTIALNKTINDLKNTVNTLALEKKSIAEELTAAQGEITALKSQLEVSKRQMKTTTEMSPKAHVQKHQKTPKVTPVKNGVKVAKIQWQLKSARPGSAMVANPKNGDLITVVTGDILAGFGKVKEIKKNDHGKWVVFSEKGNITQ